MLHWFFPTAHVGEAASETSLMAQEKNDQAEFQVVDKRRFTPAGELRPDAPETPQPAAVPPQPAPPPAPQVETKAPPRAEDEQGRAARQAYERQAASTRGEKIDFETVVLSVSTSAMYQLGLVTDQAGRSIEPDLVGARHTIDMLGVLQEKTRGNLTDKEQQLLEQVLAELRMAYVQLSSGVARPPRSQAGR